METGGGRREMADWAEMAAADMMSQENGRERRANIVGDLAERFLAEDAWQWDDPEVGAGRGGRRKR
jgi:hypothetical protein